MVRLARDAGTSPAGIALVRWTTLGALLLGALQVPAFRRLTRARWPSRKECLQAMAIGAVLWAPSHLMYYTALGRTSTLEGSVLNTTAPVWTTSLAFVLLGERAVRQRVIALVIGLVGAWLVSVGLSMPRLSSGHTSGNLLYLAGVVSESLAGVLAARLVLRSSGITVLTLQILGAVATYCLGPVLLPRVLPFTVSFSGASLGAIVYLVLMSGLVAFGGWYMLVERAPMSLMVLSLMIQPPLAALLAWAVLGETITPAIAAGSGLILAALFLAAAERASTRAAVEEVAGK